MKRKEKEEEERASFLWQWSSKYSLKCFDFQNKHDPLQSLFSKYYYSFYKNKAYFCNHSKIDIRPAWTKMLFLKRVIWDEGWYVDIKTFECPLSNSNILLPRQPSGHRRVNSGTRQRAGRSPLIKCKRRAMRRATQLRTTQWVE